MYLSKKDTPSPENYDIKGLYSQIISQKIIKINNNMKEYCVGCNFTLLFQSELDSIITLQITYFDP